MPTGIANARQRPAIKEGCSHDDSGFCPRPQVGGTSVGASLARLLVPGAARGFYEAAPASLNGLGLLASHANFNDLAKLEGDKAFVTSLRAPIDRLVSVYRFWQSIKPQEAMSKGLTHVLNVRNKSFEQFLTTKNEKTNLQLDNEITRQFCDVSGAITESDFQQALENLDQCRAIFRTEHLNDDLQHFHNQIGCGNRFSPISLNITDNNHAVQPHVYNPAENVDLDDLSPVGYEALLEHTYFDRRFYNEGLAIADTKRNAGSGDLTGLPISRPSISRGEVVVPGSSDAFLSILDHGWSFTDDFLWSVSSPSVLKFKVKGGTDAPARVLLKLNACMVPNRNFMAVDVIADTGEAKSALFLQQSAMIEAKTLKGKAFDILCAAPRSAILDIPLASGFGDDRIHTVEVVTHCAASPALLGLNGDNRILGVRLESIEII